MSKADSFKKTTSSLSRFDMKLHVGNLFTTKYITDAYFCYTDKQVIRM